MNRPRQDASTAFLRAVRTSFADCDIVVEELRSRSWASATFTGARHELTFRVNGERAKAEADAFLSNLSAAEFELRGHVMADIALVSEERKDGEDWVRISLEGLTVEDC